jgi:nucleoside 2-deoxyribosyltransferase
MKIYVASSWRNPHQPLVVEKLREAGHEVYDFRNPSETDKGFAWSDIDENWQNWSNEEYIKALDHPIAVKGFLNDFKGMDWADACVLVMPCGRSAHVEAGYMQGAGRPTIVLMFDEAEPELMYNLFETVATSIDEVIEHLKVLELIKEDSSC